MAHLSRIRQPNQQEDNHVHATQNSRPTFDSFLAKVRRGLSKFMKGVVSEGDMANEGDLLIKTTPGYEFPLAYEHRARALTTRLKNYPS